MKNIIICFLLFAGLLGLMYWGKTIQKPNATQVSVEKKSALIVSEKLYNFGTISMANGNVSKVFKITNSSDKDIVLKTLTTSCMCTSAYIGSGSTKKGPFKMPGMGFVPPADESFKAGEIKDIEVVYDPNAHGPAGVGPIDRFINLVDENGGALQLEIKANVTP